MNLPTPAEAERLQILAEECAEVVQAVTKILRHGYGSYHPKKPSVSNRSLLEKELGDVHAAIALMSRNGDVVPYNILLHQFAKEAQLREGQYLHQSHT